MQKVVISTSAWTVRGALVATLVMGCGERPGRNVMEGANPTPALAPLPGAAVLVGAGDIAACSSNGDEATAALLDEIPGAVFTAGDNVYPNGTSEEFSRCYHPSWGRHRERTFPVPGNHDYRTRKGGPYFEYFGERAGAPGRGYYSFTLGEWLIVMLNTNLSISAGSAQLHWLRQQLASPRAKCAVVISHHPRYSSGPHGGSSRMRTPWAVMHEYGVELAIAGHDHIYERFAPMTRTGARDDQRGVRQIVVGTGGFKPYIPRRRRARNSQILSSATGVLKLSLGDGAYQWEFVPIAGQKFRDWGEGRCHS